MYSRLQQFCFSYELHFGKLMVEWIRTHTRRNTQVQTPVGMVWNFSVEGKLKIPNPYSWRQLQPKGLYFLGFQNPHCNNRNDTNASIDGFFK
jgi:hypothetical protein